jgi:hypothetical protein
MSSKLPSELLLEIKRLSKLPVSARELEGIYANDAQLALLIKRLNASGDLLPLGVVKFVADFTSSDSRLLRLIDEEREKQSNGLRNADLSENGRSCG